MNNDMVCVFAKWQVKKGYWSDLMDLLPLVVEASRKEPGNLFYRVHQSRSDDNMIVLFEGYSDEAALAAHRDTVHFKEIVMAKIVPILENREVLLVNEIIPEV